MSQSMPLLPSLVKEVANDPLAMSEPAREKVGVSLPMVKSDPKSVSFAKSNEIRFQDFLNRQSNSSQEVRLELAKYQRDELAKMRAESASGKFNGVAHFKVMLQHRYTTITAAWRQLLDPTSTGKLSFCDFCQCCRDMGYQRKMKQLWAELDPEGKGWIGLDALDFDSAMLLRDFRRICRVNFGSMLNAWHALDRDKNHRLDEPVFIQRCSDMGFKGNAHQLFNCIKKDIARKYLTIQDFDEKSMQCMYRGDNKMMTVNKSKSMCELSPGSSAMSPGSPQMGLTMPSIPSADGSPSSSSSPNSNILKKRTPAELARASNVNTRWIKECSQETMRERDEMKNKGKDMDKGGVPGLKHQLIAHHGSIYRAWRKALDLKGKGKLGFGEFCLALRTLGYTGNVKDTFAALDTDNDGFVWLRDIDAKTDEEISTYQKLILAKYPNMLAAWRGLDKGTGQIDEATFKRHCKQLGWPGNARSLFYNLKEDRSRKFLTLLDYDPKAWDCELRGDLEMMSQEKSDQMGLSKLTFHERQGSCFSQRWSRMQAKQDMASLALTRAEGQKADCGVHDVASLRTMLIRKYHTMTAAWKHGLDTYGVGRLPFAEFCQTMRRIGFNGDIAVTFNELDTDKKGAVTLRDLDQEADEIVTEFRAMLIEKYGTYIKGWQAMDTSKSGAIDADQMAAACESVGYKKAHDKLFKYLLDGPGKRNITMADLDSTAMQAYWRGDLSALNPMEKAKASLVARRQAEQDAKEKSMEAHDWISLKKSLLRRYGTITSAWREGLDVNSNGKLSLHEFSHQVRAIGFVGSIKKIFEEIDEDNSGIISFNEVDSDWYQRLSFFTDLLLTKYHNYDGAWAALDRNNNNMVEASEFLEMCNELGYPTCAKALFRQMLRNTLCKYLSLEDFISVAAIIRANKADANSNMDFHEHADSHLSHSEQAKRNLQDRQAQVEKQKAQQCGAGNWLSLKEQLIRKYGTITAAWRHALDSSGSGSVSMTEFCIACRANGFQGNIQQAFKELDTDSSGIITFDGVDHEWFEKLKHLKELIAKKYETNEHAFRGLDRGKNGQPGCEEFVQFCADIGFTDDPKHLFKQLQTNRGRRFLTTEDLDSSSLFLGKAIKASNAAHLA